MDPISKVPRGPFTPNTHKWILKIGVCVPGVKASPKKFFCKKGAIWGGCDLPSFLITEYHNHSFLIQL